MKYTSGNNLSGFVCLMTQQHTMYLGCQKTHSSIPQIIPSWSKKKLNRIFWEPQLPNAFSFGLGVPCQSATSAAQREAFKELFFNLCFLPKKKRGYVNNLSSMSPPICLCLFYIFSLSWNWNTFHRTVTNQKWETRSVEFLPSCSCKLFSRSANFVGDSSPLPSFIAYNCKFSRPLRIFAWNLG